MHTENAISVLPFRMGTLLFQIPRFLPVPTIGKKKIIAIYIYISGIVFKIVFHLLNNGLIHLFRVPNFCSTIKQVKAGHCKTICFNTFYSSHKAVLFSITRLWV